MRPGLATYFMDPVHSAFVRPSKDAGCALQSDTSNIRRSRPASSNVASRTGSSNGTKPPPGGRQRYPTAPSPSHDWVASSHPKLIDWITRSYSPGGCNSRGPKATFTPKPHRRVVGVCGSVCEIGVVAATLGGGSRASRPWMIVARARGSRRGPRADPSRGCGAGVCGDIWGNRE